MSRFTPAGFEAYVVRYLCRMARFERWSSDNVVVTRSDVIERPEGAFEFDVSLRFHAFGADYLTLAECKNLKRPVPRAAVQVLHDKVKVVAAHKGMVFSTSGFQRGAIVYAKERGVALLDCSARRKGPRVVVGGDTVDAMPLEEDSNLAQMSPFSFDWVFHWGGEAFCAEHWYAAQVLLRHPSELDPLPTFWRPEQTPFRQDE